MVATMRAVLVLLTVFAVALPASAHTDAEIRQWETEWAARVATTGLTRPLVAEYLDFQLRHRPPAPEPEPTRSTRSAPTGSTGMGSNVEQWRSLVAAYFGSQTDRALCIMGYESGGNPNATNPSSGAAGLFQIMPFWWDHYGGNRYDPETNVRVAADILAAQGWTAWSPYNRGLCR